MSALRPQRGEVTTPAPRLPRVEREHPLADHERRLRVIEEHLGIDPKERKPHEPLPGSDVEPLTDEG